MKSFALTLVFLPLIACSSPARTCQRPDPELMHCPAPKAPLVPEIRGTSALKGGRVVVELTVNANGTVANAKVLSSTGDSAWKEPVLRAALLWRYKPAARQTVKIVPFDMVMDG